mmetsp:Transcript_19629/g.63758  ORF Transcript_19629/g.63758 Transcript_19629/m.63758 type:complete len:279 (-) Transcript_19629:418-1254(-)
MASPAEALSSRGRHIRSSGAKRLGLASGAHSAIAATTSGRACERATALSPCATYSAGNSFCIDRYMRASSPRLPAASPPMAAARASHAATELSRRSMRSSCSCCSSRSAASRSSSRKRMIAVSRSCRSFLSAVVISASARSTMRRRLCWSSGIGTSSASSSSCCALTCSRLVTTLACLPRMSMIGAAAKGVPAVAALLSCSSRSWVAVLYSRFSRFTAFRFFHSCCGPGAGAAEGNKPGAGPAAAEALASASFCRSSSSFFAAAIVLVLKPRPSLFPN